MKSGFIGLLVLALIGGGILVLGRDGGSDTGQPQSAEEVALHSTSSDCWTIVSGRVYDLTSYIPNHPGGEDILSACGTDGTLLFTTRTAENGEKIGPGTAHSPQAEAILTDFLVGDLQN